MNSLQEQYIKIFNSINFEEIKDHPNILIAARFWDEKRYGAAKTCYKFMRAIDDLIDNQKAATSCAIFSYMVHIIRDFQKDQLNNLNYFADELIEKNGLTRDSLGKIARGEVISKGFRRLINEYYIVADEYRQKTYDCIKKIWPCLEPRYQLSLEIIFELYLMVFERIDIKNGNFTTPELNPLPVESRRRVYTTILNSKTLKSFNPAFLVEWNI